MADPIVTVLISTPVQLFVAYRFGNVFGYFSIQINSREHRMKVITRSWIVPIIVSFLGVVSMGKFLVDNFYLLLRS